MIIRKNSWLQTGLAYIAMIVTLASVPLAQAAPVQGGSINVATTGEPPTLDPMISTTDLVGTISQHIFETLYTHGENWKIVPLLASAMPAISSDGMTVTIPLREGVRFHDGTTMKAGDVVASLDRWMKIAVRGKQAAAEIESVSAPDAKSVQIRLRAYYAPLIPMLAFNNSAAVIMPANKMAPVLTEFVGTGPFQLQERQPDRFIVLKRFASYTARSDASDLFGGKRTAYLDEIRFVPVPNPNTRVEGALSGQFSFADVLPVEVYPRLINHPKTDAVLIKNFGPALMFLNTKQGSLATPALRRAVQMSLNTGDMLEAAFGSKEFYALDGAFYPPGFPFHSAAGIEAYNQGNAVKAKEMAKAAGYTGKTIRILASSQYEFHLKLAQVAAQYMKMAGFNVDLQVSDWATLTTRRSDPALWEIYFTHSLFLPEPGLNSVMNNNAPGWWSSERKTHLVDLLNRERNPATRAAVFGDFQKLIYEEVPIIKVGDFNLLTAKAKNLVGYQPSPWPFFWNVSLQK